ncbi:MAG: hypothetical protein HZA93_11340 [Verrucomicrobia bacterium]|nr:hypothetical protein [Verrucomicrobiota bacterium]
MKRGLVILVLMAAGATAGRWGPLAVTYLLIPPAHGVYRYYETYDSRRHALHWEYFRFQNGRLATGSYRDGRFREEWELVQGRGNEHYLYDYKGEFDRVVRFSRTAMVMRDHGEHVESFARVLDPWEIWREKMRAEQNGEAVYRLEQRRGPYEKQIALRMAEQGLNERPGAALRQRPPATVPLSRRQEATRIPLLAVSEYGFRRDTGPTLVAYSDGLVICRALPENHEIPLRSLEVTDVNELIGSLSPEGFATMASPLILSDATDQDSTCFWISGREVKVYGQWREPLPRSNSPDVETESDRAYFQRFAELRAKFPPAMLTRLQKIDELRASALKPWWPEKIEVRFLGLEAANTRVIPWPAQWPGIYHPSSRKESADSYRVFVPSEDWRELRAFVDNLPRRTLVLVDLSQMSPRLRLPLPSEEVWLQR